MSEPATLAALGYLPVERTCRYGPGPLVQQQSSAEDGGYCFLAYRRIETAEGPRLDACNSLYDVRRPKLSTVSTSGNDYSGPNGTRCD